MVADNEIVAASRDVKAKAKAGRDAAKRAHERRWPLARIGLGVGIGSAAVAAALLYARRDD